MGLILIVIGAVAGWKVANLSIRAFAAIGALALLPSAVSALSPAASWVHWIAGWLAAWAFLAVPYAIFAVLKLKRDRNRADEV